MTLAALKRSWIALALVSTIQTQGFAQSVQQTSPEARAVAYLSREVPRWRLENGCASCHHNGDGARALYRAAELGFEVPSQAIEDSTQWLARPDQWSDNGGDGGFSDRRLARIQFASALRAGVLAEAGLKRETLDKAAQEIADDQEPDGSWPIDGPDVIGSPTTYGWSLSTLAARNVLQSADSDRYAKAIALADTWLRHRPIRSVMEASVELLRDDQTPDATLRRQKAFKRLREAQGPEGGWGPYPLSPPEPFDTALALLALKTVDTNETASLIQQGRAFLLQEQLPTGGWPETTRPGGAVSNAQHLSTTAWATLALLETH